MAQQSHEDALVRHTGIWRGVRSRDENVPKRAMDWPEVRSGPLVAGGILVGLGTVAALAGMAVVGQHLVATTRAWVRELETPPDQVARLKWEQAKAAAAAGAEAWRVHPNAEVRLARSGSAATRR